MGQQEYVPETMILISENDEVREAVGEILTNGMFHCEIINPSKPLPLHQKTALEKNKNPVVLDMQIEQKLSKALVRQVLQDTTLNQVVAISHNALQTASLKERGFKNVVEHPMRGITLMTAIDKCIGHKDASPA